ncbi:unnamed protein product [Urochloa decumbens]|uniref:F-box domain-containing protein n=1 Tax=Urochloa decumbens TaxID=240449 RepID=A0ABC8WBH8_9POAL
MTTSPSITAVIRAAATCKLWCRVIGDAGFLHRFRRLHGPEILGHYHYYKGSTTVFDSFPTSNAIDDIRDRLSLDFLSSSYSSPTHLALHDSRLGLLAFDRLGFSIIVCNPWTKQHTELYPPMPRGSSHFLSIFLLDAGHDEMNSDLLNMSNFRVLFVHLIHHYHDDTKIVAGSLFNARDDRWLKLGAIAVGDIVPEAGAIFRSPFVLVGHAGGSICWSNTSANAVLQLYESTGEFSRFTLPERAGVNRNRIYYDRRNLRVMGGDTGSVQLVRIARNDLEVLCYDRSSRACDGISQDRLRQLLLGDNKCDVEDVWMLSVDMHDIELECVEKLNRHGGRAFPYELPWTISTCLLDYAMEKADINGMLLMHK